MDVVGSDIVDDIDRGFVKSIVVTCFVNGRCWITIIHGCLERTT